MSPSAAQDGEQAQDSKERRSKRQDFANEQNSSKIRFGSYTIGRTLGEGEFGKVKLGWQQDGNLQVAVKMIRREKLNTEGRRMKVDREIEILRRLNHPNIVQFHERIENQHLIGVVLEYAAGGELFDFILKNHYLRDDSAQKLFAQLVSGVGYLHRNGIIHRDLKLENLLLDGSQNIIITDFGFANTFDPRSRLTDKEETQFDHARRRGQHGADSYRPGDLMSTSCGSPCYAAPELVVSDGLYHGRKVDVWSCGVILYAMLAGYLPYDDDPNNPEGDNINLLYKYICNSPLVFPSHISPHARDLLRQILVPDPKRRADLFEVARHTWLMKFAEVVEDITSNIPLQNGHATEARNNVRSEEQERRTKSVVSPSSLNRSASVKESGKSHQTSSPVGGLTAKPGRSDIDIAAQAAENKTPRDAKRRTVQVEYKAPQSQTTRGDVVSPDSYQTGSKRDSRPQPPPKDNYLSSTGATNNTNGTGRSSRPAPRSTSESTAMVSSPFGQTTRPSTGGSVNGSRLPPSRGSYGQPSAPVVASTNVQGRFSQPPKAAGAKQYVISNHGSGSRVSSEGSNNFGPQYQADRFDQQTPSSPNQTKRGHRRATTLSSILGRTTSIARRNRDPPKTDRSHPPTSMKPFNEGAVPRQSSESNRRSFSDRGSRIADKTNELFNRGSNETSGHSRQSSDIPTKEKRQSRRFSFLPRSRGEQQQEYPPLPAQQPHESYHHPQSAPHQQPQSQQIDHPPQTLEGMHTGDGAEDPAVNKGSRFMGRNRRFADSNEGGRGAGSSGAARRVMELFRRRR
ncbi:MAG: hypothetical protein M1828_002335 [Chrysothrix sp. TS-e1954]|nr:MAG: hypothetical protein M1828_002335 [Chrysothrix sp. TS-e1954]